MWTWRLAVLACISLSSATAMAGPPTCTEAGRGFMRANNSVERQRDYAEVFNSLGAKRCQANHWSDEAVACHAELSKRSPNAARKGGPTCFRLLTLPQLKALRDAMKAEVERIAETMPMPRRDRSKDSALGSAR